MRGDLCLRALDAIIVTTNETLMATKTSPLSEELRDLFVAVSLQPHRLKKPLYPTRLLTIWKEVF